MTEYINLIASVATALGVFVAAFQIWASKKQAITAFEDTLSSQYRDLIQRLPIEVLGENLDDSTYQEELIRFYHYIDLTNNQIFLRQCNRVSRKAWIDWCKGMNSTMSRPAFARAWSEISQRAPDSFSELRRLIKTDYIEDPQEVE